MSYRVSKSKVKKPSFLRSASSSLSKTRRKPGQRAKPKIEDDDEFEDRLEDLGLVETLSTDSLLRDVPQAIGYIREQMFDEIPERSGMDSTRTAEVLNFRKNLPPVVTNAHVHALINSPTMVEKEIGELTASCILKRIVVPGRGTGASSISDALVTVKEWITRLEISGLSGQLKGKYVAHLRSTTERSARLQDVFTDEEISSLVRAGFVTSASTLGSSAGMTPALNKELSGTAISIHSIARAASGSLDAIGGQSAIHRIGGGGSSGLKAPAGADKSSNFKLSLPNIGSYLKLIEGARTHLLTLLAKSKYNEAPLYLLRERWDGGINTKNPYGRSKDPFEMILPAKIKKWKEFYGLNFDWVLAECLGGGLIEVFNTRSVGLGVRAI